MDAEKNSEELETNTEYKGKFKLVMILTMVGLTIIGGLAFGYYNWYLSNESGRIEIKTNPNSIKPLSGAKPVIYLYPEEKTNVSVKLDYDGDLFVTYPKYDEIKGWEVEAYSDGRIINTSDEKEFSYLFWEGINGNTKYKMDKGFVVEGEKTAKFLQEKLSKLGLNAIEYNEFIVYWLPKMIKNNYNQIYFAGEEYTKNAKLEVTPKPNSVLRVFMVFKSLEEEIDLEEQELKGFKRQGFTLIEWGGLEIK